MRKVAIISAILVVAILTGIFFVRGRSSGQKEDVQVTPPFQRVLPTVDPSVDISLTPRADKRAVILRIVSLPADVISVDYEFTYETGGGLPRGVLGKIEIKDDNQIEREILLGTCSRDKCVYDEGVTKVSLILKFNSPSGSSQFQREYQL